MRIIQVHSLKWWGNFFTLKRFCINMVLLWTWWCWLALSILQLHGNICNSRHQSSCTATWCDNWIIHWSRSNNLALHYCIFQISPSCSLIQDQTNSSLQGSPNWEYAIPCCIFKMMIYCSIANFHWHPVEATCGKGRSWPPKFTMATDSASIARHSWEVVLNGGLYLTRLTKHGRSFAITNDAYSMFFLISFFFG